MLLLPAFPGLRLSLAAPLLPLCLAASFSPVLVSLMGQLATLCLRSRPLRTCGHLPSTWSQPGLFPRATPHRLRVSEGVRFLCSPPPAGASRTCGLQGQKHPEGSGLGPPKETQEGLRLCLTAFPAALSCRPKLEGGLLLDLLCRTEGAHFCC
jgi:hypothetical protein